MSLIPVHWIIAAFNIITCIYDCTAYVGERIFNFISTLVWNLTGYDQYFVFQDNCPTPIPYRVFMLGGTGRYKWYYNTRTREFEAWVEGAKREFLPALSLNIRQDYEGEDGPNNRYEYDLTKWLDTVKFKTVSGFFPHPMQLVAAWSLHSGVWPSFVTATDKTTRITMMSGLDGESYDINVSTIISRFRWRDFAAGSAGTESEGAEESESESESESEPEEEEGKESGSESEEEEGKESESEAESEEEEGKESESESEEEDKESESESDAESKEEDKESESESESEAEKSDDETEESEESDVSKSATSASEVKDTDAKQLVCDKALFMAGGTDEIPTWTNEWSIMPSSMVTFMSTFSMYDQIGLPPIEGYISTVNPDMEAVD